MKSFPSSTTVVNNLLYPIYIFCCEHMIAFFSRCQSFIASYDGWSRMGKKFLSQSYHMISSDTFDYRILLLDLIPFAGPQYAENFSGALIHRQELWTSEMDPSPIATAGIADAEAKGQSGGKNIWGDDMEKCQNHKLKKFYEVGEEGSVEYLRDFRAMESFVHTLNSEGNLNSELKRHQNVEGLHELSMLLFNETRWEGRFRFFERALTLGDQFRKIFSLFPVTATVREKTPDFLEESYFTRLSLYVPILKELNDVSLLYQSQSFPTGCLVPICIFFMRQLLVGDEDNDPKYLLNMKRSFMKSLKTHQVTPVLQSRNNFLKAGLLHPGNFTNSCLQICFFLSFA